MGIKIGMVIFFSKNLVVNVILITYCVDMKLEKYIKWYFDDFKIICWNGKFSGLHLTYELWIFEN